MMRSPSPLPDNVRQKSGERINDAVIDLLGLAAVARKAHWNVRGPLFGQLHALFGDVYNTSSDFSDKLAEHVAMLGLVVRGDHVEIAKDAEAEPIAEETDGLELCELVFDRTQTTTAEITKVQKEVQKLGNEDGFQLLLDTTIALSKLGWQLGSYLEGPETERGERKSKPVEESE